jgi:hypothetical protein
MPEEQLTKCLVVRHWKSRRKCTQPLSSTWHKQQTKEKKKYGVDAEQTYKLISAQCTFTGKAFYKLKIIFSLISVYFLISILHVEM